jgi:hypothetical protein
LSWLAKTHEAALKSIRALVAEVIEDLRKNNEEIPEPLQIGTIAADSLSTSLPRPTESLLSGRPKPGYA